MSENKISSNTLYKMLIIAHEDGDEALERRLEERLAENIVSAALANKKVFGELRKADKKGLINEKLAEFREETRPYLKYFI